MAAGTQVGARNALTDVRGLAVGCAQDADVRTGVTVVRATGGAVACAVDVRGGGPGTRETDVLAPHTLVDGVDAIVLSGGSVYGLAAADGVTAALGAAGDGFGLVPTPGVPKSPIVPAAILYDLANGGDKAWGETPPYRALGAAALAGAEESFALGRSGAGYGALAGVGPGGLGSASAVTHDGVTVGALVAVNCFGSVRMPGEAAFWAWPFEQMMDGTPEFGGARPADVGAAIPTWDLEDWGAAKRSPAVRANTTLAVVATDAVLDAGALQRVAIMAQDGLARAIRPVHAPFDGDVVFAVSTGRVEGDWARQGGHEATLAAAWAVARIGALAGDTLSRAVARGVWASEQHSRA